MGFLSWLSGGGSKAASELVDSTKGAVRSIRNTFAKKLTPDEQAAFDLDMIAIESDLDKAQMRVNEMEAKHTSVFVAGWRPFLGWVLSLGIAFQCLIRPILMIWGYDLPSLPPAVTTLMTILLGGTVATRTLEKFKGVQKDH
jgi:hypothetical protein